MTQQQNNKRILKNKHTYQNEPLPNRKDFVVSFITGALVGSALGLYFKNKVYQKADDLKVKEQELSQKFEERKTQLEETVAFTKERVEGFLNKSKNEQAALKAQQAAIKEEASANNLSDTSQEAQ
ncbi:TPA: YtxH domain-containing protein, partial [Staphylococcus aureus]|nr:YtxH domain-containing protein [Staphylococcus aureus]